MRILKSESGFNIKDFRFVCKAGLPNWKDLFKMVRWRQQPALIQAT